MRKGVFWRNYNDVFSNVEDVMYLFFLQDELLWLDEEREIFVYYQMRIKQFEQVIVRIESVIESMWNYFF